MKRVDVMTLLPVIHLPTGHACYITGFGAGPRWRRSITVKLLTARHDRWASRRELAPFPAARDWLLIPKSPC